MIRACLILVIVVLSGCGILFKKHRDHRSGSGAPSVDSISVEYDNSVSNMHQSLIEQDLEILSDAGFVDEESDKHILGIPSFSNENLRVWLSSRFSFLVGEEFDDRRSTEIERREVPYSVQVGFISPLSAYTVMTNIGAAYYLDGKKESRLYAMRVAGKRVLITSPRVNILQIGEGLFKINKVPGSDVENDINSYLRISTLFHEARHADGNAVHAGFVHERCIGGDYSGEYACEKSANGPYPVGRVILSKFRAICHFCSSKERKALDLQIADLESRLEPGAISRDDRPERMVP